MPILELLIRQLSSCGVERVTLAVGHLAALIMAYFGDGRRFGSEIEYSLEEKPLGTAGPLSRVHGLEETFLVMNGDLLTDLDFSTMIAGHRSAGAIATVGLCSREVQIDLGVVETDSESIVRAYIEKPMHRYDVSMGVYVLEPGVLRHIPVNERFDLPALVQALMAADERVHGYRHKGYWLDIGRPDDYQRAQDDFPRMRAALIGEGRSLAHAQR
jgi:NDP-sugar pyrophosphorylase family protein